MRVLSRSKNAAPPAMPLKGMAPRSGPVDLEDHRVALAATRADRGHAQAPAPAPQLVDEGREDPRAARADRMAEGDRAAVHVHLALVDAQHAHRVERDRCERLVDLEQVDVVDGDPRL